MSATNQIALFKGLTKKQVDSFVQGIKEEIENQEREALEVYSIFKTFEEIAKKLKPVLTENIMHDIQHEDDVFQAYGFDVEKSEVGVRYSFEHDPKWKGYQDMIDAIRHEQKEYEQLMKATKRIMVDPDTGEEIQPAVRTSTSFIKMKRI